MNKLVLSLCLLVFATLANAAEPAVRTIYLIRHGHYAADPAADEKLGPGVSPIGAAQASLVGARLAGLPVKFDTLYVSPMQRARDTAAVISGNFPGSKFAVVDDLAECTPPITSSARWWYAHSVSMPRPGWVCRPAMPASRRSASRPTATSRCFPVAMPDKMVA